MRAPSPRSAPEEGKLQIAPPETIDRTFRKLAGQSVYGANGEKLGTIKDFVVDKHSGRVVYAVVSSGGVLGAGDTLRLVPIHALLSGSSNSGFSVKVSRADWDRSPGLIQEAFGKGIILVPDEHHRMHEQLYGAAPDARSVRHRTADPSLPRDREAELTASPWIRASELRGKDIHAAGREIGEIDDVVIDLQRKTALALVDLEDDVLAGDRRVLMPVTELGLTQPARDGLATSFTREDFARLDPDYRARADAAVLPTGRATGEPIPASADATLASAVRSARQALDTDPNLARADIRVTPENGMLILRGRVRTEQLKDQAETAVKDAASGIRLQNYLIIDPR